MKPAQRDVGGGRQRDQSVVGAIVLRLLPRTNPAVILPRIDDHPVVDAQPRGMRRVFLTERRHRGQPKKQRARHISRRSEEHTSELQSLMRISYAVFCLKKKKQTSETERPI